MCWNRTSATCRAEGREINGTEWNPHPFENLLMTTKTKVYPLTMADPCKSTAIWDHGLLGIGRDIHFPAGNWRVLFMVEKNKPTEMTQHMSLFQKGHQYLLDITFKVEVTHDWPVSRLVWAHSITLSLNHTSTWTKWGGHPGGPERNLQFPLSNLTPSCS